MGYRRGMFVLIFLVGAVLSFSEKRYRPLESIECQDCNEEPLFFKPGMTPNDFLVHGVGDITSYAGFFKVQLDIEDENMFWWYFPAQNKNTSAPLLIWLQGGPGGSSLFGLFNEHGPWSLSPDLQLIPRPYTWNKEYSMLFIDNPVGAGFSFPSQPSGYCNNTEHDVASNLYQTLIQFYTLFPELLKNPLYITGESYAGHYVPAFASFIDLNADSAPFEIPLKGIAIGDGWIDPIEQVRGYPELMFNIGAVNTQQREVVQGMCNETISYIYQGLYTEAFEVWDKMLNGDLFPYGNYFHNITGSNNYDNFLMTNEPPSFGYYSKFVTQPKIRSALHVGNAVFNNGAECEKHLVGDFMKSFKCALAGLMEKYKVLIYSGQLDVIVGAPLTERFLQTVQWSKQDDFLNSTRLVWRMNPSDEEVAGFVRVVDKFQHVIVRGGGHILPFDQPERSYDMLKRFIEDIPYENLPNPQQPTRMPRVQSALVPEM